MLTIIVPTFNEAENIQPLVARLSVALAGLEWSAIFVDDDSADQTYLRVEEMARVNPRVTVVRRIGRRGLSSACIEGMRLAVSSPILAVMDADLQHDESILPAMLEKITCENCDLVIGTRYAEGGGVGTWGMHRKLMSKIANFLGGLLLGKNNTTDPMSGFFMLKQELFREVDEELAGVGFKILLDILATAKHELKIGEIPFTFRQREHGKSKLNFTVLKDFATLLLKKTAARVFK